MARAYSQDLRDRVIDAGLSGVPARQVAARFGVGIATAILWLRRARESGERTARRQGQPRRSKLDPHRDFLLGLIEAKDDISLVEMQCRALGHARPRPTCAEYTPRAEGCLVAGVGRHGRVL